MSDRVTWGEVLRRRNPNFDKHLEEAEHQRLLQAEGCVIRALNSILGENLTREQEKTRFGLADKSSTDILYVLIDKKERGELIIDFEEEIRRLTISEHERILEYIHQLSLQTDTPAGSVLQGYTVQYEHLHLAEILSRYLQGQKIMLLPPRHACHIIPLESGDGFISLSDDNDKVTGFNPDTIHDVFVFSMK